jgi:hypothetical protein
MNNSILALPNRYGIRAGWGLLILGMIITAAVYTLGLSGGYLFDDYPNIVENHGVQPQAASISALVRAALSSPSSEFKRPLASLSFAINYLGTGLDPYWMKLTNLIIHLLNGLLVFFLTKLLIFATHIRLVSGKGESVRSSEFKPSQAMPAAANTVDTFETNPRAFSPAVYLSGPHAATQTAQAEIVAALIAVCWMLLPINLTGVLYVVQRMESMANLFVLMGLIGYVTGRCRMLAFKPDANAFSKQSPAAPTGYCGGLALCTVSITLVTLLGLLAKETAVMLPLYALVVEWLLFQFAKIDCQRDTRIMWLFLLVLILPMVLGLSWLLPSIFNPATWATRDFTLRTRLLSEARIVTDYVQWTLIPAADALTFYHDDFHTSTGLGTPWTTLASIVFLAALLALLLWARGKLPLFTLGIALFLSGQLLTGTIIPLELIYEHRNYFPSFGLMLALVPLLAVPRTYRFSLPRHALLVGLLICWTGLTAITAFAWGNPLRLAEDLANRAPQSPRAQYELGRTYIIYSHYDPSSPFTKLAYAPLERAAALPEASILPEQALIFMNARMHLPLKDGWWDSLIDKLKNHKLTVQDESSLGALTQCVREDHCALPEPRMMEAYTAALSHPNPSARLLATYGDYAWNVLDNHALGETMTEDAVKAAPRESAYRITLVRMLAVQGRLDDARAALHDLQSLNIGGSLNPSLSELRALPGMQRIKPASSLKLK